MHEIIKRDRVRLDRTPGAPLRGAAVQRPAARRREPTVRLVQEGERVLAIEVTCACGETVLLELDHQSPLPENAS